MNIVSFVVKNQCHLLNISAFYLRKGYESVLLTELLYTMYPYFWVQNANTVASSGGPVLPSGPCCFSLSSCSTRLHLLSTPKTSAETLERTETGMKNVTLRHVTCAGGSTRVLTFYHPLRRRALVRDTAKGEAAAPRSFSKTRSPVQRRDFDELVSTFQLWFEWAGAV